MRPILVVLVLASVIVTPGCLRDFEEPSRVRIRGIDGPGIVAREGSRSSSSIPSDRV